MAVPMSTREPETTQFAVSARPWAVVVWDDPVNLMSYVTYVFQTLFGYDETKAVQLMLDVHHKGKAIVSAGMRERMEHDVTQLHSYGLWATVQQTG
ncbi:MAG: ATP-dependent Clp protease adapter ClpS [Mycobacteriales bacterium]